MTVIASPSRNFQKIRKLQTYILSDRLLNFQAIAKCMNYTVHDLLCSHESCGQLKIITILVRLGGGRTGPPRSTLVIKPAQGVNIQASCLHQLSHQSFRTCASRQSFNLPATRIIFCRDITREVHPRRTKITFKPRLLRRKRCFQQEDD